MAFLIGQCCDTEISEGGGEGGGSGIIGPINEIVDFTNVATYALAWNSTRIGKYGRHGDFTVFIQQEDGLFRPTDVQIVPNDASNPSQYDFDFGGLATGYIVIT